MKMSIFLCLLCFSMEALGEVIIIRGEPLALEYKNDFYYLPQNLVLNPGTTNLYVTMDGVNKVCFLNSAPSGLFEQISEIDIIIDGFKTEWNCFPYRTTVFAVRP